MWGVLSPIAGIVNTYLGLDWGFVTYAAVSTLALIPAVMLPTDALASTGAGDDDVGDGGMMYSQQQQQQPPTPSPPSTTDMLTTPLLPPPTTTTITAPPRPRTYPPPPSAPTAAASMWLQPVWSALSHPLPLMHTPPHTTTHIHHSAAAHDTFAVLGVPAPSMLAAPFVSTTYNAEHGMAGSVFDSTAGDVEVAIHSVPPSILGGGGGAGGWGGGGGGSVFAWSPTPSIAAGGGGSILGDVHMPIHPHQISAATAVAPMDHALPSLPPSPPSSTGSPSPHMLTRSHLHRSHSTSSVHYWLLGGGRKKPLAFRGDEEGGVAVGVEEEGEEEEEEGGDGLRGGGVRYPPGYVLEEEEEHEDVKQQQQQYDDAVYTDDESVDGIHRPRSDPGEWTATALVHHDDTIHHHDTYGGGGGIGAGDGMFGSTQGAVGHVSTTTPPTKHVPGTSSTVVSKPTTTPPPSSSYSFFFKSILTNKSLLTFYTTCTLLGWGHAIIGTFLFLRLDGMGARPLLMGLVLAANSFSETPVFVFFGAVVGRLGTQKILLVALCTLCVRFAAYELLSVVHLWVILPIECLHGTWCVRVCSVCEVCVYAVCSIPNQHTQPQPLRMLVGGLPVPFTQHASLPLGWR